MARAKEIRLTKRQILNCLAHIRQWVGFVSTAVEHYDSSSQVSVFVYSSGPKPPPPMRDGCPPAEEDGTAGSGGKRRRRRRRHSRRR
jgi:hypothetical protein